MGTLKKVRFKLAWQNYRAGDVIEPPGTLRDWLVSRGYAEVLEEAAEPIEPSPQPIPIIPARKRQRATP